MFGVAHSMVVTVVNCDDEPSSVARAKLTLKKVYSFRSAIMTGGWPFGKSMLLFDWIHNSVADGTQFG